MNEPQYIIAMPDTLPSGLCIMSIDALMLLREQASGFGWISVKDRVPEKRLQKVIVWTGIGSAEIMTMKHSCWNDFVTHWSPLPEQPKGLNNAN